MKRFMWTALGAFSALMAHTSSAEALAASVKAFGMAGTGVAYAQDSLAVAIILRAWLWIGDRVDLGVHWAHDSGSTKINGNLIPVLNGYYKGYKTKTSILLNSDK